MIIAKGDRVKVEYKGSLPDGVVFDSSERIGKPLEFTVGSGEVIKGFDTAVVGMKIGEEKTITIPAGEAYGVPNPVYITKVPRDQFAKNREVKTGMILQMTLPNGKKMHGRLTEVSDKEITIDFNHPLSGKALTFWMKVVDIVKA